MEATLRSCKMCVAKNMSLYISISVCIHTFLSARVCLYMSLYISVYLYIHECVCVHEADWNIICRLPGRLCCLSSQPGMIDGSGMGPREGESTCVVRQGRWQALT